MKTLVTGGQGFIGKQLIGRKIDKEKGGILNKSYLRKKIEGIECVIHLATSKDEKELYEISTEGTKNLYEFPLKQIIVASSQYVYGESLEPATEFTPKRPLNSYALAKSIEEETAIYWGKITGIKTTILRISKVWGGEVIQYFEKCIRENRPVILDGDGTQKRDFIHIEDLKTAFKAAMGHEGIFNIGSGIAKSMEQIAREMGAKEIIYNHKIPYLKDAVMSIEKAQKELNWKPRHKLKEL